MDGDFAIKKGNVMGPLIVGFSNRVIQGVYYIYPPMLLLP